MASLSTVCLYETFVDVVESLHLSTLQTSRLYWFISNLLYQQFYSDKEIDQYVSISSFILVNHMGSGYKKLIQILEAQKIICVDDSYSEGNYCKGYSVNIKHQSGNLVAKNIILKLKSQYSNDKIISRTKKVLRKLRLRSELPVARIVDGFVTQELIEKDLQFYPSIDMPETARVQYLIHNKHERKFKSKKYSTIAILKSASKEGEVLYFKNDKLHISKKSKEEIIKGEIERRRYIYFRELMKLKQRQVSAQQNSTNYRLDSNISRLKSDFIAYLKLGNERLASIDLRNSQFVLLSRLIETVFTYSDDITSLKEVLDAKLIQLSDNPHTPLTSPYTHPFLYITLHSILRISLYLYNEIRNLLSDNIGVNYQCTCSDSITISSFVSLCTGCTNRIQTVSHRFLTHMFTVIKEYMERGEGIKGSLPGDYKSFARATKAGKLYDNILEDANEGIDKSYQLERDDVKRMMFWVAFSKHSFTNADKKAFKEHYPTVFGIISSLKEGFVNILKGLCKKDLSEDDEQFLKVKGNAAFAVLLQNIESCIFIDGILGRLYKEGFEVLSKHDSILCKQSECKTVKGILIEELDKYMGIRGYRLKVEETGEEEFDSNTPKSPRAVLSHV